MNIQEVQLIAISAIGIGVAGAVAGLVAKKPKAALASLGIGAVIYGACLTDKLNLDNEQIAAELKNHTAVSMACQQDPVGMKNYHILYACISDTPEHQAERTSGLRNKKLHIETVRPRPLAATQNGYGVYSY